MWKFKGETKTEILILNCNIIFLYFNMILLMERDYDGEREITI